MRKASLLVTDVLRSMIVIAEMKFPTPSCSLQGGDCYELVTA
jgi:hypothetical protein